MMEPIFVDWKKLKELGWPYSRTHTYRLMADGDFPERKKLGKGRGGRIGWRFEEVKPYLEGEKGTSL